MTHWTEQQHADYLARRGVPGARNTADVSNPPFAPPPNQAGLFALGRLKAGEMNKTEAAYAEHLESQRRRGEILWFKFEAIKLRLANNTFYTADFFVLTAHSFLEIHEVKGRWMDDARVKIKVAASIYPFKFIAVTKRAAKRGGGWQCEDF